jgi:CRISPR type IV-associated protein Csf3
MMQPFRVAVTFKSPMAEPRMPIHLDGLLSALRVAEDENIHWNLTQHDLPLAKFTTDSDWCFKASAFKVTRISEPAEWMMTGRINLTRAAEDRKSGLLQLRSAKPVTAGGPFKTSKFSVTIIWARLEAWGIGDIDRVRELLAGCEQIGSRRSSSFGQVDTIEVDPIDEAACQWYLRNLPAGTETTFSGATYVPAIGNLKAPYWDRKHQREVLVPLSI